MYAILLLIAAQIDSSHADSVQEVLPGTETRIIHIRDGHHITKENFAIDTELKDRELDEAHAEHLQAVDRVQKSQLKILAGVKEVFGEGLTDENYPIFQAEIRTLRPFHRELASFDPADGEDTKQIFEEHRLTLLRLGAAGQLMLDEKLTVLPCEGEVYENRPIKDDKLVLDQKVIEAREDAIVRNLTKRGGTCVLVLGGAHDLSDNIKRLCRDCGYVVVTPKGWLE